MLKNERELLSQENSFLKEEVGSFILKLLDGRCLLRGHQVPKLIFFYELFFFFFFQNSNLRYYGGVIGSIRRVRRFFSRLADRLMS